MYTVGKISISSPDDFMCLPPYKNRNGLLLKGGRLRKSSRDEILIFPTVYTRIYTNTHTYIYIYIYTHIYIFIYLHTHA